MVINEGGVMNLTGMFSDPILIDEERGRIRFGTFLLIGLRDGRSRFASIVVWGWDQVEDEHAVQSGAELADY